MKWCLETTDGQTLKFDSREELQDAILDAFSEDGMNPIENVYTEEDGKRTALVTRWSVDVCPMTAYGTE